MQGYFCEMSVVAVRLRKSRYQPRERKYKAHAVNVLVASHSMPDPRPIQLHVFGSDKRHPGPLGWLRWTVERAEHVRATAPKAVQVLVRPSEVNPSQTWLTLSAACQRAWIARIKARMLGEDNVVIDESSLAEVAQDAAVITVNAAFPYVAEEFLVSQ